MGQSDPEITKLKASCLIRYIFTAQIVYKVIELSWSGIYLSQHRALESDCGQQVRRHISGCSVVLHCA